jgi:radical SAM superfamily enzyme YgiQ (UPF0313 family)
LKAKRKVGLIQIGENFGGQYYLPYSIGLLQAYAQKKLVNIKDFEFLLPVYKRMPIEEIVAGFRDAQVVFFSVYIWNFKFSLEVAKGLKSAGADCLTIFGGPQVPARPEALEKLLRDHPYIDIGCYGEGEVPFLKILENLPARTWMEAPSIGFIDSNNRFVMTPLAGRIADLDEIPSPYLEGIFDALMAANLEEKWSALWESNRGCPFNCTYCTWGATPKNKVYTYGMDRVFEEIDWFSKKKIEFVFCCDANFGLFKERDLRIAEKVAENKKRFDFPQAFSVQNTKNATKTIFQLNKILNDAGLQKGVNLALQTVNGKTLQSIKRENISMKTYRDLQRMFTKAGVPTFSDMIIGLPDETYDSFTDGAAAVIAGGQHNRIQFINLTLLENSEMAEPEYRGKYGMTLQECRQISHHATLDNEREIEETEFLVVGTRTMPKQDWIKTRIFCWMMSLLYFNKLFQIPFAILNRKYSLGYRQMVEIFLKENKKLPLISEIQTIFRDKAKAIQSGDCEYVPSPEWLNIWWPPDEYVFIKLCRESILPQFYAEAAQAVRQYSQKSGRDISDPLLQEAIDVNAQLIKKPFAAAGRQIHTSNNLLEIYNASLIGKNLPLQEGEHRYEIIRDQTWESWDEWCREVVWYGTKKGAYLYDFRAI